MKRIKLGAIGATICLLLLTAACGTGGQSNTPDEEGAPESGTKRDLNFAVVVHSDPDGSFWNVVKRGAQDAGKQYGVDVEITGDPEGSEQAKLIDAAVAKKPDGLVVSMANPDALSASLASAKDGDIPFVTINSGADKSTEFGAIGHVGQTETVAGEGAGEELKKTGKKGICIIHEAGNVGLEQRCQGARKSFGEMKNVQVDLKNPQGIQSTVKSTLLGDESIDTVLALNPDVAVAALAGVKDAGSSATVGTFDLNTDVLQAIKDGDIVFAVDQQQYLQGYLPIAMLVLYHDNLNTVGGGLPVLTGPAFVTQDNVDTVTDLVQKGTR